jgi:hypothetical protein
MGTKVKLCRWLTWGYDLRKRSESSSESFIYRCFGTFSKQWFVIRENNWRFICLDINRNYSTMTVLVLG